MTQPLPAASAAGSAPIRVLYLVESMEIAGAEQVVLSLARGLDRDRFIPEIGCLTVEGPLAPRLREAGVPVVALGKRPGLDVSVVPRLMRMMRQRRIDIVHTHVWNADVWGRVSAALAGVPVRITTAHSVDVWKGRAQLSVDRCLSMVTQRVVCVSEAVRTFYADRAGIAAEKLTVIYNGIDVQPFDGPIDVAAKRRALGVDPAGPVLSVVARLLPEKGHRHFLEALAALRGAQPRISGLIVGQGVMRAELEARSRELGLLDSVRFLGERTDVPEILRATDILVLPSTLREGLSISLLEAMAARRPVVASDVGGNRETIGDSGAGLVVPPADSRSLAVALEALLADPERAHRMGEAGRAKVERDFDIRRMVRQTETIYTDLLADRRRMRAH